MPFSRRDEMLSVDEWAFAMTHPEGTQTAVEAGIDWDRCRGIEAVDSRASSASEVAAVHSSYGYSMRVPGGTVPTSGLTWVGVQPAHRRRGLLRAMIDDHFARSLARGEVVSTLVAAETKIYQRFGYGLACPSYKMTMPRGATFREVAGSDDLRVRFEDADVARHAPVVRAILARDPRPGAMVEMGEALMASQFADPEALREGQERKRIVIVEDEHGPAAFALFRRKLSWGDTGANGTGSTEQWAAVTPAASRRLWSVLADLDLLTSFSATCLPLDDPAVLLADDVRALGLKAQDHVWLRILDLPAALTARTYGADLDVAVQVTDNVVPQNDAVWHMTVEAGIARVTRAADGAQADLRISMQDLSAAYLGGTTIDSLKGAGLVEEATAGAATTLSSAFRSPMAPRSSFSF